MQRVVHASLHGNAYAIEEQGYDALRAYLDRAAAQLADDPDRDEIVADLEQAIGEKCARRLGPHKTVITAAEMAQALEEMGPVGRPGEVGPEAAPPGPAPGAPAPAAQAAPAEPPPRRLYRVLEGALLGGLCNGLGAYLRVDAIVVRAVFVALLFLTGGLWGLVYLVLLFVVPAAGTSEERAAARGLPFSAQALVDEARRRAAQLGEGLRGPWSEAVEELRREWSEAWRHDWRQGRRADRAEWAEWRAHRREARRERRRRAAQGAAADDGYWPRVAAGTILPLLAFTSAALAVGWAVATASLLESGRILGWTPPPLPLWAALLALLAAAAVIGQPFHHARHALRRWSRGAGDLLAAWDSILWLCFLALLGWLAWRWSPDLRALLDDLPAAVEKVKASWQRPA